MRNFAHPVRTPAVVIVAVIAALVGAGAAWSTFDPLSSSPLVNAVVGGGHLDGGTCFFFADGSPPFCPPGARDFSYDAHGLAPTGSAIGTIRIGRIGGTNFVKARITCMTVVGDTAVIGGHISENPSSPSSVGFDIWVAVIDNGGPGQPGVSPDKVSFTLSGPADDPDQPPEFPRRCGLTTADFGFADLLAGDVSIHGGL